VFIKNAWYVAALDHEIGSELFPRTILGEKIVFFRKPDGTVAALEDRCVHRQVPLSKGRLQDGVLSCWYHGLKYDATGKCLEIPSQDKVPAKACVKSFPIAEKHGMIWIWMGPEHQSRFAPIPDHSVCADPALAGEMRHRFVNCNYKFGVDNILDISHAAFVHQKTLGSEDVVRATPALEILPDTIRVYRDMLREKVPPLYENVMKFDFMDRTQIVNYWPIAHTRVDTKAYPHGIRDCKPLNVYTTTIFTPAEEDTTHIFVGMHRDFLIANEQMTKFITQKIWETVDEDIDITQHLHLNWKDDAHMIQLSLDKASLAARKMLTNLEALERKGVPKDMEAVAEPEVLHAYTER
jgi:phenylpropionate dioxygenase-like ring-hydroxylating dioxygenase large terminal subunit